MITSTSMLVLILWISLVLVFGGHGISLHLAKIKASEQERIRGLERYTPLYQVMCLMTMIILTILTWKV